MLGVGLFIVFWALAVLTLGKADEIRLLMPVVPACLLFGLGPWTPWRA